MAEEKLSFGDPHDPLTMLCDTAIKSVETAVDQLGYRLMVIVVDPSTEPERSGTGLSGYDHPAVALADMLQQCKALAHTMGREVMVAPLNRG